MQFDNLANKQSLETTINSLRDHGYDVTVVRNKEEALEKIKKIIPEGASIANGSSTTLNQIGYQDYLETNNHKWLDLNAKIRSENDPEKRAELRKQSILSDYYLGSVHALTETGEMIIGSNTGSQLPHIASTSQNLIFVISTKKIVSSLDKGMSRLEKHVVPLEDNRMMEAMNMHTMLNRILIFKGEPPFLGRKIHIILVEENLGF